MELNVYTAKYKGDGLFLCRRCGMDVFLDYNCHMIILDDNSGLKTIDAKTGIPNHRCGYVQVWQCGKCREEFYPKKRSKQKKFSCPDCNIPVDWHLEINRTDCF